MQPQELLDTLVHDIQGIVKTETVIGTPITVGDNTVIPVIRMNVGFGAGGGEGQGPNGKGEIQGSGTGGGAGGGIRIEPAAFIVSQGNDVSIMAAPGERGRMAEMFSEMFDHLPEMIDKFKESTKPEVKKATKKN